MAESKLFLAYRAPGEKLQFYRENQNSPELFHFVNFRGDQKLQIALEACAPYEFQNWHFHPHQEAPDKEAQLALLNKTILLIINLWISKFIFNQLS